MLPVHYAASVYPGTMNVFPEVFPESVYMKELFVPALETLQVSRYPVEHLYFDMLLKARVLCNGLLLQVTRKTGFSWPQVSDLKGTEPSSVAALYAVPALPYTVLVDADNRVIARDIHYDRLKDTLPELLKGN